MAEPSASDDPLQPGAEEQPGTDDARAQADLPNVDTAAQADAQPTTAEVPSPTAEEPPDDDIYRVKLEMFEGPLDLLLHLIRKHELDVLDIPISFITSKYLEYLKLMDSLQIDVASEYLVMSATLAHIKSKMLLPPDPNAAEEDDEGEELDPRAELVRRLLEYQKYKLAALQLRQRAELGTAAYERGTAEPVEEGPAPLAPLNMYKLFAAFEKVLKRANQVADHQVLFERVGITERIVALTELLHSRRRIRFEELFFASGSNQPLEPDKGFLVVTFLAMLEMCKMRVARIIQEDALGELYIELAGKILGEHDAPLDLSNVDDVGDEAPTTDPSPSTDTEQPVPADDAEQEAAADDAEQEAAADDAEQEAAADDDVEPPTESRPADIEPMTEPLPTRASGHAPAPSDAPSQPTSSTPTSSAVMIEALASDSQPDADDIAMADTDAAGVAATEEQPRHDPLDPVAADMSLDESDAAPLTMPTVTLSNPGAEDVEPDTIEGESTTPPIEVVPAADDDRVDRSDQPPSSGHAPSDDAPDSMAPSTEPDLGAVTEPEPATVSEPPGSAVASDRANAQTEPEDVADHGQQEDR